MVFWVQLSAANIGNAAGKCTDFFMLERFFLRCHRVAQCHLIHLRVLL